MRKRIALLFTALMLALSGVAVSVFTTPSTASADSCHTWDRTLQEGASGNDVKELQIRVSGWVGHGETLALDGQYGAATTEAVKRFQSGYGLPANGVAGQETFDKLYELQDDDCTPAHFDYSEFDGKQTNNFEGGKVSAAEAKESTLRIMWQLEALQHKLDDSLEVTSSFRSESHNVAIGGSSSSLHMDGQAADLGLSSGPSQCEIWHAAQSAGFNEILGPGYPGHNDHVHVGNKSGQLWSAPTCGT